MRWSCGEECDVVGEAEDEEASILECVVGRVEGVEAPGGVPWRRGARNGEPGRSLLEE